MANDKDASEIIDDEEKSKEDEIQYLADDEIEEEVELSDDGEKNEFELKIAELKDQLMRTLADSENLRKRTLKDVEQAKKYSHITFVRDLVSSVDNLKSCLLYTSPSPRDS